MKEIKLVATGDSLITMKVSINSNTKFLEMVDLIRSADVAFTNLETLFHDYEEDTYPAEKSGGSYTRTDPSIIEDLKWMGFNIFSTANNHSLDYMYGGLFKTIKNLDAAEVTHSGTGRNLSEARQPAYLETSKGRIALISASSSFAPFGRAGDARRDMHGRPGLNPQRYEVYYTITEEALKAVRKLAELGLGEITTENAFNFMGKKFILGENVCEHTKPNKSDMEGNLESIQCAVRQADWVFFSLHSHERRKGNRDIPAEFIEEISRACIDAGAHAVIGHGSHVLRGIEIRDGKPIFYSLGNLISQNFTNKKYPADLYEKYKLDPYSGTPADVCEARLKKHTAFIGEHAYERWLSVIPSMTFENNELKELKLYPIDLGFKKPLSQRGCPILADSELANIILKKIVNLSLPYGTKINIKQNVGIVDL